MLVKDHNLASLKLSSKQTNEQKQKKLISKSERNSGHLLQIKVSFNDLLMYNRSTEAVCEILKINEEQFHTFSFLENYLILKFNFFCCHF